jgi:hypothetical protein
VRILEAVVSRDAKWNLGDYNSTGVFASIKVEVEKGDDVAAILQDLQRQVDAHVQAQNPNLAEERAIAADLQEQRSAPAFPPDVAAVIARIGQPTETPPPKSAAPASAVVPEPTPVVALSGDPVSDALQALGFKPSEGKPGLWGKDAGNLSMFWDFRREPKGRFYIVDKKIDQFLKDEDAKGYGEYKQFRAAQDKAQTIIDGAPKTPPPTGGRPTLPTGPAPSGRARLLLHLATSRFHEPLRKAGFQPLGAGWWWADLAPDALNARAEWAGMNRVPFVHAAGRNVPAGVPAPPEVPL